MKCSVLEATHVLGRKWSIPILIDLKLGKFHGFYEFTKRSSITPRTLSRQLKELESTNLIEKDIHGKYHLTKKGKDLCAIIDDIKKFNVKYNLVHENCLKKSCLECGFFKK